MGLLTPTMSLEDIENATFTLLGDIRLGTRIVKSSDNGLTYLTLRNKNLDGWIENPNQASQHQSKNHKQIKVSS